MRRSTLLSDGIWCCAAFVCLSTPHYIAYRLATNFARDMGNWSVGVDADLSRLGHAVEQHDEALKQLIADREQEE